MGKIPWAISHGGKTVAPYVDKVKAKDIVRRMNVESLIKIVPTLAVFDQANISDFTLDFMKSLPQPYIIKGAHLCGGVARVRNNTYHCFKLCRNETVMPLNAEASRIARFQVLADLKKNGTR